MLISVDWTFCYRDAHWINMSTRPIALDEAIAPCGVSATTKKRSFDSVGFI